jgi:bifunctional non-homologous end joining protein LigD
MVLRSRRRVGLIEPCLPSPAKAPPTGSNWLHEIKHDGFRIMALRNADGVRLVTRNGNDFTRRFPLAVAAVTALPVRRSCLIDGEAIVTDEGGLAVFEMIRRARHSAQAVLCAFDLLELDGEDLRRVPIEERKARLARLLRKPPHGIALNEHFAGEGAIVFREELAGSAARASCRSGWVHITGPADRPRGSRSRIPRRQRCGGKLRRIGADRKQRAAPVGGLFDFRFMRPSLTFLIEINAGHGPLQQKQNAPSGGA